MLTGEELILDHLAELQKEWLNNTVIKCFFQGEFNHPVKYRFVRKRCATCTHKLQCYDHNIRKPSLD